MGAFVGVGVALVGGAIGYHQSRKGGHTYVDHESKRRAEALKEVRKNNNYKPNPKLNKSSTFHNLEYSIDYKKWLLDNGKNNTNSPYYSSTEVMNKTRTNVLFFNGSPNKHIHYEDKFNYEKYDEDLGKARAAVNRCKAEINTKAQQIRNIINSTASNQQSKQSEINNLKKLYDDARKQYSKLCEENRDVSQKIINNKDKLIALADRNVELNKQTSQIKEDIANQYNIEVKDNDVSGVTANLLGLKQENMLKIFNDLPLQDKGKIIYKIYGIKEYKDIFQLLIKTKFDANIIAYLANKENKADAYEFALGYEVNLDETVINGKTILSTILHSANDERISQAMEKCSTPLVTIISSAKNADFACLTALYKYNNNIFNQFEYHTGHSALHLLALGGEFEAIKHIQTLNPDCLEITNREGESIFNMLMRAEVMGIIELFTQEYIIEQVKELILEDANLSTIKRALSYCELDNLVKADIVCSLLNNNKNDIIQNIFDNDFQVNALCENLTNKKEGDQIRDLEIFKQVLLSGRLDIIGSLLSFINVENLLIDLIKANDINMQKYIQNIVQISPAYVSAEVVFQALINKSEDSVIELLLNEYNYNEVMQIARDYGEEVLISRLSSISDNLQIELGDYNIYDQDQEYDAELVADYYIQAN